MKKYKFYADAGHGWLAVKRQELIDLGILDQITHYSYQREGTVYLEEDCDLTLFAWAYTNKHGESFEIFEFHDDHSKIRSYDSFSSDFFL